MPRCAQNGWKPKSVITLTAGTLSARALSQVQPGTGLGAAAHVPEHLGGHRVGRYDHVGTYLPHPAKDPPAGAETEQPGEGCQQEREPEPNPEGQFIGPRRVAELGFVASGQHLAHSERRRIEEVLDFDLVTEVPQAPCQFARVPCVSCSYGRRHDEDAERPGRAMPTHTPVHSNSTRID